MFALRKILKSYTRTEQGETYDLWTKGNVRLYILRKKAGRRVGIHLNTGGEVIGLRFHAIGRGYPKPFRMDDLYLKPTLQSGALTVVVLRGKPLFVENLDNGPFVSQADRCRDGHILFLSQQEFVQIADTL